MKKIILTISSVLFLAACTQFEKETAPSFTANPAAPKIEEVALPEEVADLPALPANYDADHAFAVKITPGAENVYYSFAIVKGTPTLDPSTLLKNGYAGNAVVVKLVRDDINVDVPLSGCFEAATVKDTTVVAFKLVPNTVYTVYAVASGEKGVVSEIAAKSFTTGDSTNPSGYSEDANGNRKYSFDASGLEDGTIVIDFEDPVELTDVALEGKAKFHAIYQAANYFDPNGVLVPVFEAEIPVDSLSVDGAKVYIQVPERIPGSVVSIYYDEGVVVNGVGGTNPALAADEVGAYWNAGKIAFAGITGRFETASWEFDLPVIEDEEGQVERMPADHIEYFSDWEDLLILLTAQDLAEPQFQEDTYNQVVPGEAIQIRYTDSQNRKIIYDTENYDVLEKADSTIFIALSEAPDYGSSVSVDIPEGAVEDIWGNPCEAFSTSYIDEDGKVFNGNYFFSYGYVLEDLYGTYTLTALDCDGNPMPDQSDVIIAPRQPFEDPEYEEYYAERNVEIYNLFEYDPTWFLSPYKSYGTIHYGTFNIHSGVLNIEYEYLGQGTNARYNWTGNLIALSYDTDTNNYDFVQFVKGTLVLQQDVYMVCNGLGWIDYYAAGATLEKTSDDYTIPGDEDHSSVAPAPAPRKTVRRASVIKRKLK